MKSNYLRVEVLAKRPEGKMPRVERTIGMVICDSSKIDIKEIKNSAIVLVVERFCKKYPNEHFEFSATVTETNYSFIIDMDSELLFSFEDMEGYTEAKLREQRTEFEEEKTAAITQAIEEFKNSLPTAPAPEPDEEVQEGQTSEEMEEVEGNELQGEEGEEVKLEEESKEKTKKK